MMGSIIEQSLKSMRDEGISIFIKTRDRVYGYELDENPIYCVKNENYTLEVYGDEFNINRVFPVIHFLNTILSKQNEKKSYFSDKMIEFFTSLSPFKNKKESFEKILKGIKKVLNLDELLILEKIEDRLIGINSKEKNLKVTIKEGSAESISLKNNKGVYLNIHSKLKSTFNLGGYTYIEPLNGREKIIGLIIFNSKNPIQILDINIMKQLSKIAGDLIEIYVFKEDMSRLMENSLNAMIDALDSRTKGGKNHTKLVTKISVSFGKYLNLEKEDLDALNTGCLLHDIGKIGVSDTILNKNGPLTDDEWKAVKNHCVYGVEIISKIQNINDKVKDIVMYHHEHWNGNGYPNGLKGEDIPFLARVVTFADVYEALTSDRIYRKAYTKEYAMDYIKENAGKIFDPNLSDKFLEFIGGSNY